MAQTVTFSLAEEAAELADRLRGSLGEEATVCSSGSFYLSGWNEITVQHRAAEKGAAVPALLEACAANDATVVACGDHLNDLSLFAVAERSIAPRNAHALVLEAATEVVGPNDEDGIVRQILERHLGSAA